MVSLSLVEREEEVERDNWGSRVELGLEGLNPVEERKRFLRELSSKTDWD